MTIPDTAEAVSDSVIDYIESIDSFISQTTADGIAAAAVEAHRKALAEAGGVELMPGEIPPWFTLIYECTSCGYNSCRKEDETEKPCVECGKGRMMSSDKAWLEIPTVTKLTNKQINEVTAYMHELQRWSPAWESRNAMTIDDQYRHMIADLDYDASMNTTKGENS